MDDRKPPPDKPRGKATFSPEEAKWIIFQGLRFAWLDRLAKLQGRKEIRGELPRPPLSGPGTVVRLPMRDASATAPRVPTLFRPDPPKLTREQRLKIIEDQEAEEANSPNNPKVMTSFEDHDTPGNSLCAPFDVFKGKDGWDCVVVSTVEMFAVREGGTWRPSATFGDVTGETLEEEFDPVRDPKESAKLVSEARTALASDPSAFRPESNAAPPPRVTPSPDFMGPIKWPDMAKLIDEQEAAEAANPHNPKVPTGFADADVASQAPGLSRVPTVFVARPPADCVVVSTVDFFAIRESGTWRPSPTFGALTDEDLEDLFDPVRDPIESARLIAEAKSALLPQS